METFRKEHVPSGSFRAEKTAPIILQAFLGTCVGVALYDKISGVGGIIHILLPEPTSEMAPEYPEKYASTGLPLFLDKLREMGANLENIKATIAGGALVGPVTHQDITLDIGGRSTEIAISILRKENIEILKAETGGFFMCTLELNMETGTSRIKPAWHGSTDTDLKYSAPSKEDMINASKTLQPIPQTALKILRMVQDSACGIRAVADELSKDQVLSARTLRLCNSAMFSGRVEIETLNDAVLLLGESMLVQSVITAAVKSYYNQTGQAGYSLCKGGLFFHALGCAVTAEKIAGITKQVSPEKAYTAGLLHDIGKVLLDQYIAGVYPMFFRGINHDKKNSIDMEKQFFGTTHCNTGAYLAQKWNFPKSLIEVILFHHSPGKAMEHKKMVSIIYLADLLISTFNTGLELERINLAHLTSSLDTIGLTIAELPGIIDSIPSKAFDLKKMTS